MNGKQFKTLRLSLEETQKEFAKRFGYAHLRRIQEIEAADEKPIPPSAELKILKMKPLTHHLKELLQKVERT
jgi:transcriptional regulator with XRE-family HTH domain